MQPTLSKMVTSELLSLAYAAVEMAANRIDEGFDAQGLTGGADEPQAAISEAIDELHVLLGQLNDLREDARPTCQWGGFEPYYDPSVFGGRA